MKNKKLAIVAVGGNSLVKDEKRKSSRHQYMIVKETAHHIADMIEAGWDMAIGHGNGVCSGGRREGLRPCDRRIA